MDEKTFQGDLGLYRQIQTEDQSFTLWSQKYDENCHSLGGAREETEFIYLTGCRIREKALTHKTLNVLEVGYGAGVGTELTLKLMDEFPQNTLYYVSLELDSALVKWSESRLNIRYEESRWKEIPCFRARKNNCHVLILVGDARKTVEKLPENKFHAVYQDAFSPRKNPELWNEEWFLKLSRIGGKDVRLSTFSASACVHEALQKAGWDVIKKPGFKKKRASTRAVLKSSQSGDSAVF